VRQVGYLLESGQAYLGQFFSTSGFPGICWPLNCWCHCGSLWETVRWKRHVLLHQRLIIVHDNTRPCTTNQICDWARHYEAGRLRTILYNVTIARLVFTIALDRFESTGRQATPYTTSLTELYLATDTRYRFLLAGIQAWCHEWTDASLLMVNIWRYEVHNLLLTCFVFFEIRINFSASKCLYCFFFVSVIKILNTFLNQTCRSQTDRHVEDFHIYLAFIIFWIAWISRTFLSCCFISFLTHIV